MGTVPGPMRSDLLLDFRGSCVHVLQIGLGTNSTFLQRDSEWIVSLLGATALRSGEGLTGIGVDPVAEHVAALAKASWKTDEVSLVVGAVGGSSGTRSLFALPPNTRRRLHRQMDMNQAQASVWNLVDHQLDYLENMSCLDAPHRDFQTSVDRILSVFPFDVSFLEERRVPCFTFEDIFRINNAIGCQVLLIDAEGADCEILQSMVNACAKRNGVEWPRAIMFETRGHANTSAEPKKEERTIMRLHQYGYRLVFAGGDSILLHGPALERSAWFARWADEHFTLSCEICRWQAWPSQPHFAQQVSMGCSQWSWRGAWTCTWCTHR